MPVVITTIIMTLLVCLFGWFVPRDETPSPEELRREAQAKEVINIIEGWNEETFQMLERVRTRRNHNELDES